MSDQDKTREQLLDEVRALRDRLALLQDGAARQRQAEERFATTFRANPVGISLSTLADGRFVDVNDSFLRLLGRPRQDVVGRTSVELGLWGGGARSPERLEALHRQGRSGTWRSPSPAPTASGTASSPRNSCSSKPGRTCSACTSTSPPASGPSRRCGTARSGTGSSPS